MWTKLLDEVRATNATQAQLNTATLFGFVPEEILALCQLVALGLGTLYGFQRIGVITRIPGLRRYRHRGGREVLHLFQLEVQLLGLDGQLSHIGFRTTRMTGDEVGDELLVQMFLPIDAVKDTLEVVELLERRLAHQV